MNASKSTAYLIRNGRPVAIADTAAKNGEVVSFGFELLDDCIHEVGRATVSRAKKWDRIAEKCSFLNSDGEREPGLEWAFVNYGSGAPI
jgi:hypothetical protein